MDKINKRKEILSRMKAMPVAENGKPVAVIGLSAYLPGCNDLNAFWQALDNGETLISELPAGRLGRSGGSRIANGSGTSRGTSPFRAGMIPDIRQFDAGFFGILPGEAASMDPRKRMLLMSVYHAMEDAGYAPRSFRESRTAVFVAIEEDEYRQCIRDNSPADDLPVSNSASLIANELSYYFDLRGPSEIVNTMCSGGAVALHRAVQALRSGEAGSAIVCAANLLLHEDPFTFLASTGQLSRHSIVRSFGKEADGYLRADGVVAMVLKPLAKALEDKDSIYAVIRQTAVNYNGRGGLSMAAPNIAAHTDLIRTCYEQAGVDPRQVGYIEAQGMGNPVADIAEWEACNRALIGLASAKGVVVPDGNCRVSTLKPMTGHMHAASALGALLKVIRSFQTGKVYGILGFDEVNPDLDLGNKPCRLVAGTEDWPAQQYPRLAGIHSYGSGGNNAHILVEEYKDSRQEDTAHSEGSSVMIIPVSATTDGQCRNIVGMLVKEIEGNPHYSLEAVAFTMQTGRDGMAARVAFVAATREEFLRQARSFLETGGIGMVFGKGDGHTMAWEWVKGALARWDLKIFKVPVQRLHLPGYPFDCRPYWFSPAAVPGSTTIANTDKVTTQTPAATLRAEQVVRELLSPFFQQQPAEVDLMRQFSDSGFDSLLVTRLAHTLRKQYDIDIEPAVFFEHTSPRQLIAYLAPAFEQENLPVQPPAAVKKAADGRGDIAIIGIAGNFPQAASPEELWQNLVLGKNCIEEVPADRWSVDEHYHPDKQMANRSGKSYGKWGGFLQSYYHFDPLFFNIPPVETELMSPKERHFLQCAWHALEDAGYTPRLLEREQVGVFAGVTRGGIDPYKTSMFTIANRVSYVFNLHGPSMTIDTACSSSLVAIHEACRHIRSGECSVALAGGVHVFLDPSHFSVLSSMYMLSPDGSSKAFGSAANGMVPGEGAGIVLLKPLEKAIADGDHIYAVIKASTTNHGGKANGFTVPNPLAHRRLIRAALEEAGVNARTVSYVEAHGTGTPLGDPIEIRGLTEAFRMDTVDARYCRIGSLKTNIGHLEAAAGVAGLIKILLQMKHRKLVPSLHSRTLNPQIKFEQSPFVVQQELEDWKPTGEGGQPLPKIACVSSFGAGGSNAHLVVEEFAYGTTSTQNERKPSSLLFLLSAKDEEQLHSHMQRMLAFIGDAETLNSLDLRSMIYTLQTGRVHFEERLAILIDSLDDLKDQLKRCLEGSSDAGKIWRGRSKTSLSISVVEPVDTTLTTLALDWMDKGEYGKLATSWVEGAVIDWMRLFMTDRDPAGTRRIPLPGYPFRKEYYGLPALPGKAVPAGGQEALLHPLLHRNTSHFGAVQYVSNFGGKEFFLRDHVVRGEKILPGVAYLEMAGKAMVLACGDGQAMPSDREDFVLRLRNIVWAQPAVVKNETLQLYLTLARTKEGDVGFRIAGSPGDEHIHSQGNASLIETAASPRFTSLPSPAELAGPVFPGPVCYDLLNRLGVEYGPGHRVIREIYAGPQRVWARLVLPDVLADTIALYQLHPAMLDGALQAIIGFILRQDGQYPASLQLPIPYALEELTALHRCSEEMWVCIERNEAGRPTGGSLDAGTAAFDLTLLDTNGRICFRMLKYTARMMKPAMTSAGAMGLLLLKPDWEETALPPGPYVPAGRRLIIHCEESGLPADALQQRLGNTDMIALRSAGNDIGRRLTDYTIQLAGAIKNLLSERPQGKILLQLPVPVSGEGSLAKALYGLLRTARAENPVIHGQLITLAENPDLDATLALLGENSGLSGNLELSYTGGKRRQKQWREYTVSPDAPHPWKEDGLYLISGGMGGVGLLFARDILQKTNRARVVLVNRSSLDARRRAQLDALGAGDRIGYRQADISLAAEVDVLVKNIMAEYGGITGILHCAGILRDGFLLKKTGADVADVLAPKVAGAVNLDRATSGLALDLFLLCSSTAAVIGNGGQGDYAAANAFLDAFARHRNDLVTAGLRSGGTLSVNWPLWRSGGMRVETVTEKMMFDKAGMRPMETAVGLRALYALVASHEPQLMVLNGDPALLKAYVASADAALPEDEGSAFVVAKAARVEAPTAAGARGTEDRVVHFFKQLLSAVIKLPVGRIDPDTSMDHYGIDSIMVMQMTNELEKTFGSLSKTLFFEYTTIRELAIHFMTTHPEKLQTLLPEISAYDHTGQAYVPAPAEASKAAGVPGAAMAGADAWQSREKSDVFHAPPEKFAAGDIAIVGLSGAYPQADDLREFWDNLRNGRNCVTEIPDDRWDHSLYFDRDKNKRWKTYSRWGGFLDGVDAFDALFFNISPKEAEILDPQERLFLQCAYRCLEDAGYTRQQLVKGPVQGKVGVYVGVMWSEYQLYGAQETALGRPMALSSSPSSIANRVSYFCNFNGPSLALDTMCSSSLTAIHLACKSLQQGECRMAIAGGVNVSVHPNKYLVLGYGKLASTRGLCESFGSMGDGYVPSEGVGAVLLKPLSQAVADGDHIYGVIRGSAINHGGKVNGYTVPNPKAQAKVIAQALADAGFDPRSVSYIEAHGTGTALGDPIEIAGLAAGFDCEEKQFCAIGSVKSNIGHCESAAGIAGLTKVLLQMKYGQIVPSLHSAVLNPNIDFANSPFVVQQELREWRRPRLTVDDREQEFPRRAGISSFGAGGANAHLLVEEYMPAPPVSVPGSKVAILLSAKDEERLLERASQLLAAVRVSDYTNDDLPGIAFTLQTGREAMDARLAMEVSSIEDLEAKLALFTGGHKNDGGLYSGNAGEDKETFSGILADEDMDELVTRWLGKGRLDKLLGLWVRGLEIDWPLVYDAASMTDGHPRRISLPTYPFKGKRYWPSLGKQPGQLPPDTPTHTIHPLVHQNTSTFYGQKFSSVFNGEEFFLRDHVVNGEKLLPGVAYLEMVNEAMIIASGQEVPGIKLENMVWSQPLTVNGHGGKLDIGLTPGDDGGFHFEICSQGDQAQGGQIVHSAGRARYLESGVIPVMDIEALRASLDGRVLEGEQCYRRFARMGIVYGPAQRGIERIYVKEGRLLAELKLPAVVADTLDQYCLHPSLMDASLQAVIGFLAVNEENEDIPLAIPFAIRSLEILGACTHEMWAYVRYAQDSDAGRSTREMVNLSFDIDVCDATGKVCVRMEGFTSRVLKKDGKLPAGPGSSQQAQALLMATPRWHRENIDPPAGPQPLETADPGHVVVLLDDNGSLSYVPALLPGTRSLTLYSSQHTPAQKFGDFATQVFEEIQKLFSTRTRQPIFFQVVFNGWGDNALLLAIAGLIKTAARENPAFTGQLIALSAEMDRADVAACIRQNAIFRHETIVRYIVGIREVLRWERYHPGGEQPPVAWKEGGVYLITGGAGGLGLSFVREITACLRNCTIVLTGRSPISDELEKRLVEFRSQGATVVYRQADIGDATATSELIHGILQSFGALNGVIHSAGVIRDNYILRKPVQELKTVFEPKVNGLTHLDLATKNVPLDFFCCFSSSAAVTGNAGQADYAMGNAFMDAYASLRRQWVAEGLRNGTTVSINWPLWKQGGMHVSPEHERMLQETTGMVALETATGIDAFYRALGAAQPQMLVAQGDVDQIYATFLASPQRDSFAEDAARTRANVPVQVPTVKGKEYGLPEVAAFLKKLLSSTINLPAAQINAGKPMEEYGIESVMIMQMTGRLEKIFGSLSKTLFFEYGSINELAGYFVEAFPEKLRLLEPGETPPPASPPLASPPIASTPPASPAPVASAPASPPTGDSRSDKPAGTPGAAIVRSGIQGFTALAGRPGHPGVPPAISPGISPAKPLPSVTGPHTAVTGPQPGKEDTASAGPQPMNIAIVGLAGRYPQARNLQEFWQVLKEGRNCVTPIPDARWNYDNYGAPAAAVNPKGYGKWGGFLDGVDQFDPLFFGISAREAEMIDPQERLFLQCVYETLEDAGYTRAGMGGGRRSSMGRSVGVFAGVMWDEYQLYGAQETASGNPLAVAGISASIANRVSYFCDFHGPSVTLNTMCSSSLTAIHMACQSILQGDCSAAIAGGVNLSLHPNKYVSLGQGNFLSSRGLCESFGAGGDGYVPGEGVGAVLLKPLSDAIADNDHIYCVIQGSSVNHGGKTNGFTVPSPRAQGTVITAALRRSHFDVRSITCLEAHGTGTSLGDPIEIAGLHKAFGPADRPYCSIGSVKSNIGHCESASGIAGLTKLLLQLKHRKLAPSLHSSVLNPHIEFGNGPFFVQQELADWERPVLSEGGSRKEYPRRAGLSSFGAGGANAHILVEEFIPAEAQGKAAAPASAATNQKELILLSARTPGQLTGYADRLLNWLGTEQASSSASLGDIAYTLQVGREPMSERLAILVSSMAALREKLEAYMRGTHSAGMITGRVGHKGKELLPGEEEGDFRRMAQRMKSGDYEAIMTEWIDGTAIDWERLHRETGSGKKHRISLPTYPFATERYWISRGKGIQPAAVEEDNSAATLMDRTVARLCALFAAIVKYPVDRIDPEEPTESYGIDSVMIIQLNSRLADIFGQLPTTIFYEFQTLQTLAGFLVKHHRESCAQWTDMKAAPLPGRDAAPKIPATYVNADRPREQVPPAPPDAPDALYGPCPIAVIGLAGRYPMAADLDEYWDNLKAGRDCITEIPAERWAIPGFYHPDAAEAALQGKSYGKWGGFIDGFADFDPKFFGLSPKDARNMDPHARLFIESCWEVLEDAGYRKEQLARLYNGNVGIYAGITRSGFSFYTEDLMKMGQYPLNTMSAVANRASYLLNLKGPSVPIDTMCSSSLTAIHEACESLLAGRCEMAIAGGVNLLLHPSEYVTLSANNFLSTDGRCRSFGAGGDGYVPGEGVGTVLLKPLSKAIADRDHIYCVIRSTSINHGGKTNGYTVPNPVAQGDLVSAALERGALNAGAISFMEAHGTGTPLGDPIEIAGLTQAFVKDSTETQYCAISSSKSNIGHLEAAAGIAGVTKIILQMKNRLLVPNLHSETLNPNIRFAESPFVVQRSLSEWKRPVRTIDGEKRELPRIAGISSFGAGGSNAHVIVQEYAPRDILIL